MLAQPGEREKNVRRKDHGPDQGPGRYSKWSRRRESNPQPIAYKAIALPLSYAGGPPIVTTSAGRGHLSAGATNLDLELDLALDALKRVVDRLHSPLKGVRHLLVGLSLHVEAQHLFLEG